MLAKLVNYEGKVTLVMNTGVQFLDFGLKLDLRRELPGEFIVQQSNLSLARLQYDQRNDRHYHPSKPGVWVRSRISIAMDESAKLLDAAWFPIPLLRINPPREFASGPETWARARLIQLSDLEAEETGHSHRLTLAIDTTLLDDADDIKYLAPTRADVQTGVTFAFAHRAHEIGWYPELPWVAGWIEELFTDNAEQALGLPPEELDAERDQLLHHAHYLNLLAIIGEHAHVPEVKLLSNAPGDLHPAVQVDMVLDVGNSRTCGILIEEHPKEGDGLGRRYELELRDLSQPHQVCTEPFESRVEFTPGRFGKEHWAHKSGRGGAFLWPTIARVGPEAARLAGRRRGTEGATGISSPKRYLWDEDRFDTDWRFNNAGNRGEIEPMATAAPFCNLINETGSALYLLPDDERMPVFMPHYSRSSMMMFMLAEVLTQAQCQINSPAQRLRMPNADLPRHLRSIILTVPPAMPRQEREIFRNRVEQAMVLVWKAFGWHPEDDDPDNDEEQGIQAWPPFPRVEVRWDEATCGQAVYLFSEIQNTFAGRPEEFFAMTRRQRGDSEAERQQPRLTVASVDIGGGTTDLVINDYALEGASGGANRYIVPEQRFRDGFKVAGDDILLEIIGAVLIPALTRALQDSGIEAPDSLLSRLIGSDPVDVQQSVLRQQLALQILYPAGLAILKAYEDYDPLIGAEANSLRIGELLATMHAEQPTEPVLDYFATGLREESGGAINGFDLLDVGVVLDLNHIHQLFMSQQLEITRAIRSLSEIIHLYDCDVLLLTGRPSCLPGVQTLFRALLALPPDCIIPMNNYRTGAWYPFNHRGRVKDPKTTAAVGAMLCVLGQGRLPNFFFRADEFRPYSTVRYLGLMDQNMIIKRDDVFYQDVDLDDPDYELPDTAIPMHGVMHLGYRQLAAERWGASPLYVLDFADEKARQAVYQQGGTMMVRLKRERGANAERFAIASVDVEGGRAVSRNAVVLKLNTLSIGLDRDSYWLDSGSVFE